MSCNTGRLCSQNHLFHPLMGKLRHSCIMTRVLHRQLRRNNVARWHHFYTISIHLLAAHIAFPFQGQPGKADWKTLDMWKLRTRNPASPSDVGSYCLRHTPLAWACFVCNSRKGTRRHFCRIDSYCWQHRYHSSYKRWFWLSWRETCRRYVEFEFELRE